MDATSINDSLHSNRRKIKTQGGVRQRKYNKNLEYSGQIAAQNTTIEP
jgi:hypothetical protein